MKKCVKALVSIVLSLAVCFICTGYAKLTDSLTITGTVDVAAPQKLYITSVEVVPSSSSGGKGGDTGNSPFPTTLVNSTINTGNKGSGGSWWNPTVAESYTTVTYKITVFNNTPYKYSYVGLEYTSGEASHNNAIGTSSNSNIRITTKDNAGDSSSTFNTSDSVEPGKERVFYATYRVNNNNLTNTSVNTLVNYKFGVHIDSVGDAAADKVIKQLGVILNNASTYQTLIDKIDDKYDGSNDWTSNFIGNVWNATSLGYSEDTETINTLFGANNLKIYVDGEEVDVTLLIKREDVDGNQNTGDSFTATKNGRSYSAKGCEMTIYVTSGDLQMGSKPTVYAATYTCNKNADGTLGEWYLLGERYEGTAQIVGYMGGTSNGGSFDTGTWRSVSKTYAPADNYGYNIAANQTIQTIIQAKDSNAVTKLQNLLNSANKVLTESGYAGEAVVNLQEAVDRAARVCSSGITVNKNATRAQLIPVMKDVEHNLQPFEEWLASH